MTESLKEGLYKVVRSVASPLRFFAVAVVCLAAIIIVLAWKSTLPPDITNNLIVIAFGSLLLLIAAVTFLVIVYPKKLVFDQEAHLTVLREHLSDSELKITYIPGSLPQIKTPASLLPGSKGK